MNSPTDNVFASNLVSRIGEPEETLRIIASLPAPEGLEDRVREALERSPRTASVLPWPSRMGSRGGWAHSTLVRGAAAAAIVFVVGGGSWGVYSRVHPAAVPKVVAVPRVAAPGGFSSAGAMRTPQTLNGPVLTHPVKPAHDHASALPHAQASTAKKLHKSSKPAESVTK